MGLVEDLISAVSSIVSETWTTLDGRAVPDPENLRLGNDARKLQATVLYADMTASTKLVDEYTASFAAEVYKAYLTCAARLIRANHGVITAYDGDRVMGVYLGDRKNSNAALTGLQIDWAVANIVNPALKAQYPKRDYVLSHVVGIDTSELFAARIGVRNDNDLVWVGRAANYAAKLCAMKDPDRVYITDAVYKMLGKDVRLTTGGDSAWEARLWTEMNDMPVYRASICRRP
jgi:class 3 adenylate cyclase